MSPPFQERNHNGSLANRLHRSPSPAPSPAMRLSLLLVSGFLCGYPYALPGAEADGANSCSWEREISLKTLLGAAAFLAGTIAGAKPMKTSFTAMRLGIVIYFVPLFFLFQPALLLQGDLTPLFYALPSIVVGIMLISGGLEGYLLGAGLVKPGLA